ncbi:VWA domain-containing protein [Streptomyces sp. NPDC020792]|uniref:VWA domain-containing protein n=1 Tax=Streptomyces sp. NPDC020792 TaxID=3365089 RepID=UPI00378AD41E
MSLITTLDGLVDELRATGIPVSTSEKVDAAAALGHTDIGDREAVRNSLAVALVKSADHLSAFDTIFDVFFGTRVLDQAAQAAPGTEAAKSGSATGTGRPGTVTGGGSGLGDVDDETIRRLLMESIERGEENSLLQQHLSRVLVDRHAGIQSGRAVAGTYYLYRAMRALDVDRVSSALVERAEERSPAALADPLARRLFLEDVERRLAAFRLEVEAEIRRRLVADRGAGAVAKTLRRPLPEDVDFLTAATAELHELRDTLQPLSRKLAAGMVHKRRHGRRGRIDVRRTMRASLSTGGLPVDLHHRAPRPAKPELVVLADISGSVSTFAAFTLQLTCALRTQFSKVRCFVFVDGVDEVTDVIEQSTNVLEVASEINRRGLGVWLDGRSDYGNAIDTYWREHGKELRSRTTVLVLGDARSNYHAPRADALGRIADRSGHLFWLNPEPRASWDSGDSVIGQYAKHCDEVVECRNLRQLRSFVERLA